MPKARTLKCCIFLLFALCGCQKSAIDCNKFCETPNRHEQFKSFSTEKQFEYFNACPCWGDSISEKYMFAQEISENDAIVEFILDILRNENDDEVLTNSIEFLNYLCAAKDLKGRRDVSDLVNNAIHRIEHKDERELLARILGGKPESRKARLEQMAKNIEEKTR